MDVNHNAVKSIMEKHDCTTLIHGHTHRPYIHAIETASGFHQRIVHSSQSSPKTTTKNGFMQIKGAMRTTLSSPF